MGGVSKNPGSLEYIFFSLDIGFSSVGMRDPFQFISKSEWLVDDVFELH